MTTLLILRSSLLSLFVASCPVRRCLPLLSTRRVVAVLNQGRITWPGGKSFTGNWKNGKWTGHVGEQ